jgi:hypothetical protein
MFAAVGKKHASVNVALLLTYGRARAFFDEYTDHLNCDFDLVLVNKQPVRSVPESKSNSESDCQRLLGTKPTAFMVEGNVAPIDPATIVINVDPQSNMFTLTLRDEQPRQHFVHLAAIDSTSAAVAVERVFSYSKPMTVVGHLLEGVVKEGAVKSRKRLRVEPRVAFSWCGTSVLSRLTFTS